MLVLGIETTCDETAAAVVERGEGPDGSSGPGKILSNVVLSQVSEHAAFGGVVPEIAARAHVDALDRIIAKALADAQPFDRRDRRGGGGRGPRPDRRCHRRADHRQGDRDGRRQAADGDQPPRGACADGAAHLGRPVSLLPVPRLRRPHPDRRGAGRSATTRCSAPPRTTRSARPSTRPRSCWGWAIRAARRWRRKRCGEIRRGLLCRGRCRGGPSRTFRCRG